MSVGVVNKQTGDRIPTAGMPAIDNALDLTSVNPVQNAIITAALANKQDKTDNNLETTAKTIVGAINEHEGDISSLMSGLTNVDVALSVPEGSGKNLIPMTVSGIKAYTTDGTWSGNDYTLNNVVFTILTDSDGYVTGISANGTASARSDFNLVTPGVYVNGGSYKLNGCPADGSSSKYRIQVWNFTQNTGYNDYGTGADANVNTGDNMGYQITIYNGYAASNLKFYPMLRLSTTTDATFAPYIPSVNARLESVEKPSNIIAILIAGANVNAWTLGVILPKDVKTGTITRVIPLGGSGVGVNLPLTVTNYDYESRGTIDGSVSVVGSDTLLNIAREYCTQVNISLTY